MELEQAEMIAKAVIERLRPFCSRIQVAGSVRRRRPLVNDIDLVIIPFDPWGLNALLPAMGQVTMNGARIQRVKTPAADIDIYVATPETWATILLIRTGSVEHNIKLCSLAKSKGMHLHADGSGLFKVIQTYGFREERIAGDSEASIFNALGIPYKEPEERN